MEGRNQSSFFYNLTNRVDYVAVNNQHNVHFTSVLLILAAAMSRRHKAVMQQPCIIKTSYSHHAAAMCYREVQPSCSGHMLSSRLTAVLQQPCHTCVIEPPYSRLTAAMCYRAASQPSCSSHDTHVLSSRRTAVLVSTAKTLELQRRW